MLTTICVDVMGADKEPEVLLKGVTCALEKDPDLCVLLAGSAGVVEPYCASHERARALVTTEVIGMAEHPASAVRQKKDASIVRAAAAVRAGEADGLFSAGSTGAVLTAATFGVGRIKGVKRPGALPALPGLGQPQDHLFGHGRKRGRQARGHGAVRPHGTRLCRGCPGHLRRARGASVQRKRGHQGLRDGPCLPRGPGQRQLRVCGKRGGHGRPGRPL